MQQQYCELLMYASTKATVSPLSDTQSGAPKKGKVKLPLKFLDMADMWDVVERPSSAEGRDMYGEYTPAALRTHSGNLAGMHVEVEGVHVEEMLVE